MRKFIQRLAIAAGLAGATAGAGLAAPFTPGNLVVARVGDGSAALSSAATAIFLLEYTPAGTLVQTIAVPTAASGSNYALTASGSATSELNITRSADGQYLTITGYDAAPGTAGVAGSAATTVSRVIGRVAANGTVDTSTRINDAFDANNIRSAFTADGANFYAVGANNGVRYLPLGNPGPTVALAAAPANIRYVNSFGGNLYVASGSGATLGISQIGTGLPTATGQSNTVLADLATATGSSPYAFYFADLSTAVAGVDVAYVADDRTATGGGIQKYSLVGGTWTLNGTIAGGTTPATVLRGLAGSVAGNTVTLAASAVGGLYVLSDATGYNVAPTAPLPATPQVASVTNTVFRGVAFAPVAPATLTATPAGPLTFSTPANTASASQAVSVGGSNLTAALTVTASAGYQVATATAGPYSVSVSLAPAGGTVAASPVYVRLASAPTAGTINGTLTIASPGATSQTLVLNGTVSIGTATRAAADMQLALYPNPAHDVLTMRHATEALAGKPAELLDLTGRVVRTTLLPATSELSVHGLPPGIYVLRVAGLSQRVAVQ